MILTMLSFTRAEILPMLWGAGTASTSLNCYIDERQDAIIVFGHNTKLSRELGFVIAGTAIRSGAYRAAMREAIRQLVYMLEFDPEEFLRQGESTHKDMQSWSIH